MGSAVASLRSKLQDGEHDMLYQYLTPLRPFLRQADVNEVVVNRPGEVLTEGPNGWESHACAGLTFEACMQLARLIANFNGKSISAETPVLSASLIYGERVQVVIPPACESDTVSITIRKPSLADRSLDELEAQGAFSLAKHLVSRVPESESVHITEDEQRLLKILGEGNFRLFLEQAVKTHKTLLIAGATGSGKTTISKSLIRCIPLHERLITIEDVHELFLPMHQNKVHLFYGRIDEGGSKVTPRQALASCMRMKPDRVLLAELRGQEAWDFVDAINTGHPGSISTLHANNAIETFTRLAMLAKQAEVGGQLPTDFLMKLLFTTVDVVLFYKEKKLMEVYFDPRFKRKQMV